MKTRARLTERVFLIATVAFLVAMCVSALWRFLPRDQANGSPQTDAAAHRSQTFLSVGLAGVALLWVACALVSLSRRRQSTLAEFLAPSLQACGCRLLSSSVPKKGVTGPFPQPSGTASHPVAYLVLGYPWHFRIVRFTTPDGREREAWARLFFAGSQVQQIDWNPPMEDGRREAEQPSACDSSKAADGLTGTHDS